MPTLVSTGQLTINDYNDGMTVYLSNEGMSLPADAAGVVTDFTGASSTLYIFLGQVDDSASWTVVATPSTGITGSLGAGAAARTFTVTGLTAESAYVDFNATKAGSMPLTRRFSVSKARKGVDGTPGTPGTPGTDGISSKRAYAASSTSSTTTAPAATTGPSSVPSVNQGGITGTWQLATPTLVSNQYLWIVDGSYSTVTNQITWGVPYWSSLRVGSLSATAVDTGSLNISGDVTTTNGHISLKADGSATFKSLTITGAGDTPILGPGDTTIKLSGLPEGVKNNAAMFTPAKTWEFRNSTEGTIATGCTLSVTSDSLIVTSTGIDPYITLSGIALDGKINDKVRMRVKRNAGSGFQGGMYWANSAHVIEGGYVSTITNTTSSVYSVIEWDMSAVTDWTNGVTTQIRFDLGNTSADIFEIDWISVGKVGPASTSKDTSNLIDLSWWKRDAVSPWGINGPSEFNRLIMTGTDNATPGPKGVNDVVWYCEETVGNSATGGGWENAPVILDPTKTYRFVVPVRRLAGAAGLYWGTNNVCTLNTTADIANPYFITHSTVNLNEWYLLIGYLFPAGSTGNTHSGSGIFSCTTGALLASGTNYNMKPGATLYYHRAYQYYATAAGASQIFGRPMVNIIDGTEPSLREYFSDSAMLNASQLWSQVSGAGRPADNATVGANATNLNLGVGSNLLSNSLPNNLVGYSGLAIQGNHGYGATMEGPILAPKGTSFDIYSPLRQCLYIHIPTVTPTVNTYQDIYVNRVTIIPSRRYEFAAYVSAHRCMGRVRIAWYTGAGAYISETPASATSNTGAQYTAGAAFPRVSIFGVAPSNACFAMPILTQLHDGGSDPYTFWSGLHFGEALDIQTALTPWAEGAPASVFSLDYTGTLNASSDITLIGRNCTVNGNKIVSGVGSGVWDADVYSKEGFTGGAHMSASPGQVSTHDIMFGLDTNPTQDRAYANLDYVFYLSGNTVYVYESGNNRGSYGTYVAGDIFSITYDGTAVRYFVNDTLARGPIYANITAPIHFDSSFYNAGAVLNNVKFTPLAPAWITNGYTENGIGHVVRPVGGSFSSGPISGSLEIQFPPAVYYSNTMVKFKVEIYEYNTGKSCSYVLSGYNYPVGPLWYNVTAEFNGPIHARKRVRFGHNAAGTRNVVWIGNGTNEASPSAWDYPQIRITEVSAGYTNWEHTKWSSGWSLAIGATSGTSNNQVDEPGIGGGMARIDSITASNVAAYIAPSAIGNAQFGGDLFSTNWNGVVNPSGAGWYLERSGNFYGNNIKVRGSVMAGSFSAWAWPAAGNYGFYLGSEGLLIGNYNNNKYVQITSDGNLYAPKFYIENGNAYFTGVLSVGATAAGSLASLTTTIGTLRARTTGGRTEIADDIIRVFDGSNNVRVKIGYLL